MIAAFLFAAVILADWPDYSSDASPRSASRLSRKEAPSGSSLLHVSAAIGYPSVAGQPMNGAGSCIQLVEQALPRARDLAKLRAQTLADELGITLGPLVDSIDTPTPVKDGTDPSGCGRPKIGMPPPTGATSETFAIDGARLAIGTEPVRAPPEPVETPFGYYPFAAPLVPPSIDVFETISTVGFAKKLADAETVTLSLNAEDPDTAQRILRSLASAIRSAVPKAIVSLDGGLLNRGPHDIPILDGTHTNLSVTIERPDIGVTGALRMALDSDARNNRYSWRAYTLSSVTRCADLEDAARLDAIARIRAELFRRGYSQTTFPIVFADAEPTEYARGSCGAKLDYSLPSYGDDGLNEPFVTAFQILTLQFGR